jgi:hypothetical protein
MKFTSHLPTAYSVYFGFLVQAQKNSSSSDSQCSKIIEDIGQGDVAFNATGTTTLSLLEQDDWHLSVTFQFRQARNTSIVNGLFYRGDRAVFLSVPESITETTVGNGIKLCYYEMDALNITSDSGESNDNDTGCGGVLSEECQKALRSAQGPRDEKCRPADVEEACGRIIRRWTSKPFNLSQQDCTLSGLPGVELPSDYLTQVAMAEGILLPEAEEPFLDSYDLLVRQPRPMLITARLPGENGNSAADIACLAANNISKSSRVPRSEFPPSSATHPDAKRAVMFFIALSCLNSCILAL